MIDREARNRLAESFRQLASGRISNDEFESHRPALSADRAIAAVYDQAWFLYSDLSEYKLTGPDRLPPDVRHAVKRAVLFLHSDLEYEWPDFPLVGFRGLFLNIVTFGRVGRVAAARWAQGGDVDVWPFINHLQLDVALARPRLLAASMPN